MLGKGKKSIKCYAQLGYDLAAAISLILRQLAIKAAALLRRTMNSTEYPLCGAPPAERRGQVTPRVYSAARVGSYLYGCGAIVSAHNSSGHFRIDRDDADAVLRSIPIASIWERRKEGGVNIYADLLIGAVLYVGAIMG